MQAYTLENAFKMNRLHPDTFGIPGDEELASIREGTFLKVCANFDIETVLPGVGDPPERFMWEMKVGKKVADKIGAERFWVKVLSIQPPTYLCEVANDLVYTKHHGLYEKVRITVEPKHILGVLNE